MGRAEVETLAVMLDLLGGVTDEVLLRLSERNPGYQFERDARGRLVVSPTGGEGGRRSGEVFLQLGMWNRRQAAGVVFDSSTGFNLPDGSCLSPDASWIGRQRWQSLSAEQRRGFPPLCPDAVFEIRSESDSLPPLHAKLGAYLAGGARIAVLIDPVARTVEIHRPGREPERHERARSVQLGPELASFTLDLDPVFDA